jgi:hypothetical protein
MSFEERARFLCGLSGDEAVRRDPYPESMDSSHISSEWRSKGEQLSMVLNLTLWALGDWAFAGESHADYDEMSEITGLDHDTVMAYLYTAGRFREHRRRRRLTLEHHWLVSGMGSDLEQDAWLEKAEEEGWTPKQLAAELGRANGSAPAETLGLRACACGCGPLPLNARRGQKYRTDACEARARRRRNAGLAEDDCRGSWQGKPLADQLRRTKSA